MLEEKLFYDTDRNILIKRRGNFEDDKLNGEGEMICFDENRNKLTEYRGRFRDDKLNGEGVFILYYRKGGKLMEAKGIFTDGLLRNGEVTNYNGNGEIMDRSETTDYP